MGLFRASQAIIGDSPAGRPLISNGDRTIYVDPAGGDDSAAGTESSPVQSIQEAVNRVPIYLRHQYIIDLATVPSTPATYDEDVLVPTVIGTGMAGQEDGAEQKGPIFNLQIRGGDSASDVEIGSMMFANPIGVSVCHLISVTFTGESPHDDENHAVSAYGTGEVHLFDIAFTDGPTNGILAYGAKMKAAKIRLGRSNLEYGIHGKRHASISTTDIEGETTGDAFRATENARLTIKQGNRATGNPRYFTRTGGTLYNLESETWFGINSNRGSQAITSQSGQPEELSCGDIWYEDGSGDADEGFYGQTENGPVRLG